MNINRPDGGSVVTGILGLIATCPYFECEELVEANQERCRYCGGPLAWVGRQVCTPGQLPALVAKVIQSSGHDPNEKHFWWKDNS